MSARDGVIRARLTSLVSTIVNSLPDSVGRVLRPARYRGMPAELPPIEPLPDAERRVLVGALNTAGQGYHWAQALSGVPATTAVSLSRVDTGFRFPVDIMVPSMVAAASRDWQRKHFRVRGLSATDIIIESGLPIFGPAFGHNLVREVRALQERDIRVAIICHGSDVRDVEALNARNPHSPFRLPEFADQLRAMQRRAAEARRVIRRTGVPILGSTQGVLIDLPEADWVPVVIGPERWQVETSPLADEGVPLVVHAPSRASIKGSDVIDAVLERLAAEGLVRYERLEKVSHDQVRDTYRRADIMIDSLRTGGYGVAACEAMAAGRVVVSNVSPDYRRQLRERYGVELPMIQADPNTLETVLRGVFADRAGARAIAAGGPPYVTALHDGRESARVMLAALDRPTALAPRG